MKSKDPKQRTYQHNVAPVRERGLKLQGLLIVKPALRRSRKGAWIEIARTLEGKSANSVAPVRERGLKSRGAGSYQLVTPVAPVRERGLK